MEPNEQRPLSQPQPQQPQPPAPPTTARVEGDAMENLYPLIRGWGRLENGITATWEAGISPGLPANPRAEQRNNLDDLVREQHEPMLGFRAVIRLPNRP